MVCALRDGTVDVVDIPDAHIPRMRSLAGSEIRKVAFSADARFIAIGSADSRVWIVDTNIDSLRVVMRHGTGITAIAFNNDGTRLAVGTESSPLMVIAVLNIAAIQRFSIDQIPYLAFAPSGDGLFVLSLNPRKDSAQSPRGRRRVCLESLTCRSYRSISVTTGASSRKSCGVPTDNSCI